MDPEMPELSLKVCGLCLSTVKRGVELIRQGNIKAGINHIDQLVYHIEKWQKALKEDSKDAKNLDKDGSFGETDPPDAESTG